MNGDDYVLFAELYPALRRFAGVVADSDMEPDDLVQDALANVLRTRPISEIENPAAYLKRAIVNTVANDRRRKSVARRFLPRLARSAVSSDSYPSDLGILDQLGPIDRAVLFLADVEGLPLKMVASELELSDSAVRKRASRARRTLKASLNDDHEATQEEAQR